MSTATCEQLVDPERGQSYKAPGVVTPGSYSEGALGAPTSTLRKNEKGMNLELIDFYWQLTPLKGAHHVKVVTQATMGVDTDFLYLGRRNELVITNSLLQQIATSHNIANAGEEFRIAQCKYWN